MNSYQIIVSGKVQKVYYRKFISQNLMRMNIQGYIHNLSDGTVEVIARIYDDEYDSVMQILKNGSPMSQVASVNVSILKDDDIIFDGFEIR